jgi:hypothetical protein
MLSSLDLSLILSFSLRASAEIALFPLQAAADANPAVVKEVDEILAHPQQWAPDARAVAGTALDGKLGGSAIAAVKNCSDTVRCLQDLGRRANARELVIGRARAAGNGLRIVFLTIDARDGSIVRKMSMSVASKEDAATVLGGSLYTLLGMTEAGFADITGIEATTSVIIDGQIRGQGPKSYEVAPGRRSITLAGVTHIVHVGPGRTIRMRRSSDKLVTPSALAGSAPVSTRESPLEIAVAAPAEAPALRKPPHKALLYSGAVVAGLGAASLITGLVLSASAVAAARGISPGASQIEAARVHDNAQQTLGAANIAMIAGGAVLAIGATLFGVAWAVPQPLVTPQVTLAEGSL